MMCTRAAMIALCGPPGAEVRSLGGVTSVTGSVDSGPPAQPRVRFRGPWGGSGSSGKDEALTLFPRLEPGRRTYAGDARATQLVGSPTPLRSDRRGADTWLFRRARARSRSPGATRLRLSRSSGTASSAQRELQVVRPWHSTDSPTAETTPRRRPGRRGSPATARRPSSWYGCWRPPPHDSHRRRSGCDSWTWVPRLSRSRYAARRDGRFDVIDGFCPWNGR